MSKKYNRTPHLPWSVGKGSDDKVAFDVSTLLSKPIIVSEKIDGSNCSIEKDNVFARTHSHSPTHPSFDHIKAFHSSIKSFLPEGFQFFGENVFALHSIAYSELPAYFLLFAIRTNDIWLSWDGVCEWAEMLGVPTVPVLWTGIVSSEKELEKLTKKLMLGKSLCGGEKEGIVVRIADEFDDKDFFKSVMKQVRANHVNTDEHWSHKEIIRNGLRK
jgi:hypothetical protein